MSTQAKVRLEEQSRIAGSLMAFDAKVASVAQAVAAAQQWKKGLFADVRVGTPQRHGERQWIS